jgi:hypothetical protein
MTVWGYQGKVPKRSCLHNRAASLIRNSVDQICDRFSKVLGLHIKRFHVTTALEDMISWLFGVKLDSKKRWFYWQFIIYPGLLLPYTGTVRYWPGHYGTYPLGHISSKVRTDWTRKWRRPYWNMDSMLEQALHASIIRICRAENSFKSWLTYSNYYVSLMC